LILRRELTYSPNLVCFHLAGVFCQFSERTSFKMIPGSGISLKSPGYVPAKSISYGRRQVMKSQKKELICLLFLLKVNIMR